MPGMSSSHSVMASSYFNEGTSKGGMMSPVMVHAYHNGGGEVIGVSVC